MQVNSHATFKKGNKKATDFLKIGRHLLKIAFQNEILQLGKSPGSGEIEYELESFGEENLITIGLFVNSFNSDRRKSVLNAGKTPFLICGSNLFHSLLKALLNLEFWFSRATLTVCGSTTCSSFVRSETQMRILKSEEFSWTPFQKSFRSCSSQSAVVFMSSLISSTSPIEFAWSHVLPKNDLP
eukprot:Pompholyxophrys_punicea_v1_NODE_65_length_3933_cov_4.311501.p2 type:complete len:184 gc:universal NODE_65_length_3933_cov_4.311501:600-49(-)